MNVTLTVPDELHADSRALLARFATELAAKMRASEVKHGFANDWMLPRWISDGQCIRHFSEHVLKGDPRDVAIYAAFLWHHGARTTFILPTACAPQASGPSEEAGGGLRVAVNRGTRLALPADELRIENLADHPEHITTVARWLFEEWGQVDGYTTAADTEYRTRHALQRDSIPMTLVGFIGDAPIATVSLWPSDLQARQDLGPWVAGLYVDRSVRGFGIGRRMIAGALAAAARVAAIESLYLHTEMEGYYELFGWEFIDTAPLRGHPTRIYRYQLEATDGRCDRDEVPRAIAEFLAANESGACRSSVNHGAHLTTAARKPV